MATNNELIPTFLIINGATIPVIRCGDDGLLHGDGHPFCDDPACPCHEDAALLTAYITQPLRSGLLTRAEAARTFYGKQV